ncbi:MAG: hypothetical protein K0A93_10170 [Desulfuromonadaceae bacterium]|nr:hypothetical protein [Desulfuromonadaceae bacterium]
MTYGNTYELISDSLKSLQRSGVIPDSMDLVAEAVILGMGSELDSLGFVSFISELEERLSAAIGKEIYLILDDIHSFNEDKSFLNVETLARFIVTLTQETEQ